MISQIFRLNIRDFVKAAIMAVLVGAALPIIAMIQTPGFNLFTADLTGVWQLALNGAIIGFVTYLTKNFLSDENGKLLGAI